MPLRFCNAEAQLPSAIPNNTPRNKFHQFFSNKKCRWVTFLIVIYNDDGIFANRRCNCFLPTSGLNLIVLVFAGTFPIGWSSTMVLQAARLESMVAARLHFVCPCNVAGPDKPVDDRIKRPLFFDMRVFSFTPLLC